jgi:hypothetical protein
VNATRTVTCILRGGRSYVRFNFIVTVGPSLNSRCFPAGLEISWLKSEGFWRWFVIISKIAFLHFVRRINDKARKYNVSEDGFCFFLEVTNGRGQKTYLLSPLVELVSDLVQVLLPEDGSRIYLPKRNFVILSFRRWTGAKGTVWQIRNFLPILDLYESRRSITIISEPRPTRWSLPFA